MVSVKKFKNDSHAFNYIFNYVLEAGEIILLKMPAVTANKRGINDIGFLTDDNITIYATISEKPDVADNGIWQEINPFDEINKTTSYMKIVNTGDSKGKVIIRAILN